METGHLKKRFKDLTSIKLTMDKVYSNRDIENKIMKMLGNTVLWYSFNGKKVTVITSEMYGKFIEKLKPGVGVVMIGDEVEMNPEYKGKVWKVRTEPSFVACELAVWLEGFSGSYSCMMLRLAEQNN